MIELLLSQLLNGVVVGSVYALIALGFSLVFGVANLINFAQGALLMLGAFAAFSLINAGLPIVVAAGVAILIAAGAGMLIERLALRPLRHAPALAPLLSTLAIAVIADTLAELVWSAETQAFPSPLQAYVVHVGGAFLTGVDLMTFAVALAVMGALTLFLSRSWTGQALRATAQDPEAAAQMGIDTGRMRQLAFGLAGGLAGLAGILVAMYYQSVFPQMGVPFGIKGFAAALLGGLASIPGAVLGGFVLGILENLASGYLGEGVRDLVAYAALVLVLMIRPHGLLGRGRLDALGGVAAASGAVPTTSILAGAGQPGAGRAQGWMARPPLLAVFGVLAAVGLVPLLGSAYLVQLAASCAMFALLALGLTLLSGTAGVLSIGQAALFGFGAYAGAILSRQGASAEAVLLAGGLGTALLAVVVSWPALRLQGHAVALATLATGQVGYLVFLLWIPVTRGPMGIAAVPRAPLWLGDVSLSHLDRQLWLGLGSLALCYGIARRLLGSSVGRSWRAIREDRPAAAASGLPVQGYLALAAGVSGLFAGIAGVEFAWLQAFVSPDSFVLDTSIVLISMVVLGGMGNPIGAMLGGALLALLPEALRGFSDWRMVAYGVVLLALLRLRPQGLAGVQ